MTRQNVAKLLQQICNFEIVAIPGLFAEGLPDDSAPEKRKREAEQVRSQQIVAHNTAMAEHGEEFEVPSFIRVPARRQFK